MLFSIPSDILALQETRAYVARVWEPAKLGCCEGKKYLRVCSILRVL